MRMKTLEKKREPRAEEARPAGRAKGLRRCFRSLPTPHDGAQSTGRERGLRPAHRVPGGVRRRPPGGAVGSDASPGIIGV